MSLSKPLVDHELFCSKLMDCEEPITKIKNIISANDPKKFEFISKKFDELRITKVKDMARSIIRKADRDTLAPLYRAIEIYYSEQEHPDNLMKSAKSKFQNENVMNTQNVNKELHTHDPKEINVILRIAKSFFDLENYEQCLDWLEKAKKMNPKCPEVLHNLAFVYMKKSEYDLAKEYLFEALSLNAYSAEAWRDYAQFSLETNDLEAAEVCYVLAISYDPKSLKKRNDYGLLLVKLNKIKEAKKEFKIALKIAKECPDILNNLADVYYKCGKFGKSILRYKQVLEIDPDRSNVYYFLGMAYFKTKEYQNALNAFTQAVRLEPENVSFLNKLAATYDRLDDMVLCTEMYKKCLTLVPEDYELNLRLSQIYSINIKDHQEAAKYLKKCIELHPDGIDLLDLYKKLFHVYKNSEDLLNASDVSMTMGDLYLEKDDQENATIAFLCALEMNRMNAFGHWKLGLTLMHKKDLALKGIGCAIELKPNLINVMMSFSSGIQRIKDEMQWCSSWWCPKHGSLKEVMPYLNEEEKEEDRLAYRLAVKRQNHWSTKTKVKCCVFDRKKGKDNHTMPPASFSKYSSGLLKTGDGKIESVHSEAHMEAAASFLHHLEEILKV